MPDAPVDPVHTMYEDPRILTHACMRAYLSLQQALHRPDHGCVCAVGERANRPNQSSTKPGRCAVIGRGCSGSAQVYYQSERARTGVRGVQHHVRGMESAVV